VIVQGKGPFKLAVKDTMSAPLNTINKETLANGAIMLVKSKILLGFRH
jgi:hypothetical protein